MSILETLTTDHDGMKKMLTKLLKTEGSAERAALLKLFGTELIAHSKAEEKVFYSRMKKGEEGKDEALEGTVEHEIVERLVEDLGRIRNKASDEWTARCSVLQEMLEHHIEEEEGEFFETARSTIPAEELEKMSGKFIAEKEKVGPAKAA